MTTQETPIRDEITIEEFLTSYNASTPEIQKEVRRLLGFEG